MAPNDALSRAQDTELVVVGIGQDYPIDIALADVDPSRPEGDQTVDRSVLITVGGRSNVEVDSVLPGLLIRDRQENDSKSGAIRRHHPTSSLVASSVSQSSAWAQKRARPSGSFASKQSAPIRDVMSLWRPAAEYPGRGTCDSWPDRETSPGQGAKHIEMPVIKGQYGFGPMPIS